MTDRFDAMIAFVAVCDGQGSSAAARRLELSPSVVTRLVAGLEDRLGVRLLQRTTRSVKLTDAGERFLERARRILSELDEAEQSALGERVAPRGRLVVAAPLLFGRLHVCPVMTRYLATYTEVSAELLLSDRFVSMVEDGVDLAIRIGDLADSGLIARRLGWTRRMLVASPAYLQRKGGPPRKPADLAAYDLIGFRGVSQAREWSFNDDAGLPFGVPVRARLVTDSGDAAIQHALADGGITHAFSYQVEALRRTGELVEVLGGFAAPPVPIQAVFPTSRLLSSKVRAFLDLIEQAAATWSFLDGSAPAEMRRQTKTDGAGAAAPAPTLASATSRSGRGRGA